MHTNSSNLTSLHPQGSPRLCSRPITVYYLHYQVQVQVELYCHSAACGDIQWNEMSCLTGPRCYIKQTYNNEVKHYKPIDKTNLLTDLTRYTIYKCVPYTTKDKDRKYKLYKLFTLNVYPIQLKIKIKNTNYANASHKYCTCAERNIVSQQLAGEQYKKICGSA